MHLPERSQEAARGDNSVRRKLASKISRRSEMKTIVSGAKAYIVAGSPKLAYLLASTVQWAWHQFLVLETTPATPHARQTCFTMKHVLLQQPQHRG
jgi:hypothetical protein